MVFVVREEAPRIPSSFAVLGHDFRPRHIHINRLGHGRRYYRTDEAAARQVCRRRWCWRAPLLFLRCWRVERGEAADLRPQQGRAAQREHFFGRARARRWRPSVSDAASRCTRPLAMPRQPEAIDGEQKPWQAARTAYHACVKSVRKGREKAALSLSLIHI